MSFFDKFRPPNQPAPVMMEIFNNVVEQPFSNVCGLKLKKEEIMNDNEFKKELRAIGEEYRARAPAQKPAPRTDAQRKADKAESERQMAAGDAAIKEIQEYAALEKDLEKAGYRLI